MSFLTAQPTGNHTFQVDTNIYRNLTDDNDIDFKSEKMFIVQEHLEEKHLTFFLKKRANYATKVSVPSMELSDKAPLASVNLPFIPKPNQPELSETTVEKMTVMTELGLPFTTIDQNKLTSHVRLKDGSYLQLTAQGV